MPIQLAWDNNEKTILRQTFVDSWTWEEFASNTLESIEMLKSVPHEVDVISDFRKSAPLPLGSGLTHSRNVMRFAAPNLGLVVFVSNQRFILTLVTMFQKVFHNSYGKHFRTAETIEAAYAIIAQRQQGSASSD